MGAAFEIAVIARHGACLLASLCEVDEWMIRQRAIVALFASSIPPSSSSSSSPPPPPHFPSDKSAQAAQATPKLSHHKAKQHQNAHICLLSPLLPPKGNPARASPPAPVFSRQELSPPRIDDLASPSFPRYREEKAVAGARIDRPQQSQQPRQTPA